MSMPTFPQTNPPLTREGSLNEIISSIAAEELSLSHILNAEGEKLQYVLGTLPGLEEAAALEEVMQVNRSVQNTVFTVNTTGRYRIAYTLNTTTALGSGTRLLINNSANLASTVAPQPLSRFSNEIILDLNAGSTVSLQIFGVIGSATLLPGASGATLSITRLS